MVTVRLWQLYQNEMFREASQSLGWKNTCRFRVVVPGNEELVLSHNQYNALEKRTISPLRYFISKNNTSRKAIGAKTSTGECMHYDVALLTSPVSRYLYCFDEYQVPSLVSSTESGYS